MRPLLTVATLLLGVGLLWLIVMWPNTPAPTPAAPPANSARAGEPAPPPAAPIHNALEAHEATADEATSPAPAAPQPPAAAPPPSSTPPAAQNAPEDQVELFDEVRGPLEELKRRFEHEPRDSAASDAESTIRAAFEPEQAHEQLLRSVLCRSTICRIELRWSSAKLGAYVAAMGRMSVRFAPEFASTVAAPAAVDPNRSVELYVERKP